MFADVAYSIGVRCPKCHVRAHQRCMTSGSRIFPGKCHRAREKEAKTLGTVLRVMEPIKVSDVTGLRKTMYFIDSVGGIEQAKKLLNAAAQILGKL